MTIGIDLTDSALRGVRLDEQGAVAARAEQAPGAGGLAAAVRDVLRKLHGTGKSAPPIGVAVVAPGEEQLPPELGGVLHGDTAPAALIAAGPAAAIAESWCGAAKGLSNVVTFSIADHVTAGVLVNGALWRGAHGFAGSVGWLALNPVEREDYRRYGGLEAEVGAAGIVRRLVWRIKSGDRSRVVDLVGGDLARLTSEHVFAAARAGDGVCISVVRDTAKYVGMAVSNLATVLDPEAVVLGGTLAASGDMMLEAIRHECSRRLHPAQCARVKVLLSTLGADAVAIGAARAAGTGR
jgi:glucokinase